MTARLDLTASRNIAWAPTIDLFYEGEELPLAGANIAMQVRLYPGAPGAAIGEVDPIIFQDMPAIDPETMRCLRLTPAIPQATLAGFPTGLNQPEPGEADAYSYDIVITYADAAQDKLALGKFILEPGVTRA
jgi:hypothetical protein